MNIETLLETNFKKGIAWSTENNLKLILGNIKSEQFSSQKIKTKKLCSFSSMKQHHRRNTSNISAYISQTLFRGRIT